MQQVAVRMGNWKAIQPAKNKPFELYDLSKDLAETNNVADKFPDVLAKMEAFAQQSHTENLIGEVLDKNKAWKDHQSR